MRRYNLDARVICSYTPAVPGKWTRIQNPRAGRAIARLAKRRVLPIRPDFDLSFVHAYDLIQLIAQLVTTPPASIGPFFVSDGATQQMEDVIDIMERALSGGPAIRLFLNDGLIGRVATTLRSITEASGILSGVTKVVADLETTSWACSPDMARESLAFVPQIEFRQGMADTIRWYERTGQL